MPSCSKCQWSQLKQLVASTKGAGLHATYCKWHSAMITLPAVLMIIPYSLSRLTNDQTGTVHKHMKPLYSALKNLGSFKNYAKQIVPPFLTQQGEANYFTVVHEDCCCMAVHSMGAPLMPQIFPIINLRLQTIIILISCGWLSHTSAQSYDKATTGQTGWAYQPAHNTASSQINPVINFTP